MYFRLLAAILDIPVIPTSETIFTVLMDADNDGVVVGFSLPALFKLHVFMHVFLILHPSF